MQGVFCCLRSSFFLFFSGHAALMLPTDLPFRLVLSNEGRINSFNAALNQFIQMQLSCSQLIFPSALSF